MIATAIADQRESFSPPAGDQCGGAAGFALVLRDDDQSPIVRGKLKPVIDSGVAFDALAQLAGHDPADISRVGKAALRVLAKRDRDYAAVLQVGRVCRVRGTAAIAPELSPLGCADELSKADRALLERLFVQPPRFVDHDELRTRPAGDILADADADAVPPADVTWYIAALSGSPSPGRRRPTLTASQIHALLLAFNLCRWRAAGLLRSTDPQTVGRDAADEILAWHARACGYRNAIACYYLPLAVKLSGGGRVPGAQRLDVLSEMTRYLLMALETFGYESEKRRLTFHLMGAMRGAKSKMFARSANVGWAFGRSLTTGVIRRYWRALSQRPPGAAGNARCVLQTLLASDAAGLTRAEREAVGAVLGQVDPAAGGRQRGPNGGALHSAIRKLRAAASRAVSGAEYGSNQA